MTSPLTTSVTVDSARIAPWMLAAAPMFAVAWGGNEFTPLLVMYRTVEHFSVLTVDVLLAAYVVGIVPGLLIGGPLSDRWGRRRLMIPAPLLGALGSIVLAIGASSPLVLAIGRVCSGVALGLVMAVGTSWIKELSAPPFEPDTGAGARRAAITMTAGFGLGAAVAAALAQFAPYPTRAAYVVNAAMSLVAFVLVLRAPETRVPSEPRGRLLDDLRIPSAMHRRFFLVVAPTAPWVFGTAASAYAILPSLLAARLPNLAVGFAGLLCLVALGVGVGIQSVARRIDRPGTSRGVAVAIATAIPGMLLAAVTSATGSLVLAVVAAAALGLAYGLLLVGGLQEVQRIAGPDDLAGLTAVYYSISYVGFFIPAALAELDVLVGYPILFVAGAVIATACLGLVLAGWSRDTPGGAVDARE